MTATPIPILEHNFVGSDYDIVNMLIHNMVHIPQEVEWHKMNPYPFRGTLPRTKAVDEAVFQAIHSTHQNTTIDAVRKSYKNFRSESFFANMFITNKPLHGHQYRHIVVFDTSTYSSSVHQENLALFQKLAKAFVYDGNILEIYSIKKDRHEGTRSCTRPFARDHIALLVVRRLEY